LSVDRTLKELISGKIKTLNDSTKLSPLAQELKGWINTGNWGCIESYLSTLPHDQYDANTYLAKGLLLTYGPLEHRDLDQALESLESSYHLEPDGLHCLNTLSEILLQTKQYKKSLMFAQKARRANPKNAMAAVALGRAAWACRNKVLAYDSFQEALGLLPEDFSPVRQQVNKTVFKIAPFWWSSLKGKGVTLVRMGTQHRDFILKCRNNISFRSHYNLFHKTTPEDVQIDLKESERLPLENNKIEWVVEKNGVPIGLAALVDLDLDNSRAEILVGFPDDVPARNTVESALLVLEFAFSTLGLGKVYSYVYSDNPCGQRNNLHLGFEQEGFLKSHVKSPVSNMRLNLYVNGCLPEMFFNNDAVMKMARRLLGRIPQRKGGALSLYKQDS